jgi:hypothetical protein
MASAVTLVEKAVSSERLWLVIHADTGPYLLCVWYRPPQAGETETITSLEAEWVCHNVGVLGTIIVGDLNVHHIKWLGHSSRNSIEGEALRKFCDSSGLRQIVRGPTRGEYLLDLVITDLDEVKYKLLHKFADHKALWITLRLPVPKTASFERTVWHFRDADWEGMQAVLAHTDWSWISNVDAHMGAQGLTEAVMQLATEFIPQTTIQERKSTHPWVNSNVVQLVLQKRQAEGTEREDECRKLCSRGIMEEYNKYVQKERQELLCMQHGFNG